MQYTVMLFATFKDKVGADRVTIELPVAASVKELKEQLVQRFPEMGALLGHAVVSINRQFAFDEDPLPEGAEVAVFPPVSGGSGKTVVKVVHDPLDTDDLLAEITDETTGAVCLFSGIVRGVTTRGQAHQTAELEYEAYIPMAEEKMRQVADEIREQWSAVEGIVIVQRIGRLQPKTPTVLIACSAAHRDTGVFEAARYGIDRLKEIVPVWKKEIGPNGQQWVEGDYLPERGD